jgi:uncharacterized protein
MWQGLAKFVLRFRGPLLIVLLVITIVMGFFALKVKLSYEFSKAIPTDNPRYLEYVAFKEKFGDDGNLLVAGVQTDSLFKLSFFDAYRQLHNNLKQVEHVEDVLSIPSAVDLYKDSASEKLVAKKIFADTINTQAALDSAAAHFYKLPFYRSLLYNPQTKAYLVGVRINKTILNSKKRSAVIANINKVIHSFGQQFM